jgi:hypothetical protein
MELRRDDRTTLHLAIYQANSAGCGSFDGLIG